ncbi:MAG TPA: hypothetical protein HA315_05695 [Candidatus Thalassarchaeaceae archaeon]|jgi:WD40 repeat protein|nr:MAG TPA: hypothetical protein D7H72_05690 [Candidatus Poseidoniales archaeon]HII35471.1 hypothetical protein [Candidatus Thalassarchaeaceae archaeon]|tara:strand:- start:4594 stop:5637 length:1044 start_codon:yes stop_codon:yes gene_type:complete
MRTRNLGDASSFIRDLGSCCSAILFGADIVIAGSKEGVIRSWSIETGQLVFDLEIEGPISDLAISQDILYVSCSSNLVAISMNSGKILWNSSLEGSSDSVVTWNGFIWALSSVYEIDISDYTESTLWKFNDHGSLVERWSFAEKGWHMGVDDGIVIGMGRPSCGFVRVNESGVEHMPLVTSSPVTIGCDSSNMAIFGLSDGSICNSKGELYGRVGEMITSLISLEDGWACGDQQGLILRNGTEIDLNREILSLGVGPNGNDLWASVWEDKSSFLSISPDGSHSEIFKHHERIVVCGYGGGGIAFGDVAGKVFLVEERFENRFDQEDQHPEDQETEINHLRERLRRLR